MKHIPLTLMVLLFACSALGVSTAHAAYFSTATPYSLSATHPIISASALPALTATLMPTTVPVVPTITSVSALPIQDVMGDHPVASNPTNIPVAAQAPITQVDLGDIPVMPLPTPLMPAPQIPASVGTPYSGATSLGNNSNHNPELVPAHSPVVEPNTPPFINPINPPQELPVPAKPKPAISPSSNNSSNTRSKVVGGTSNSGSKAPSKSSANTYKVAAVVDTYVPEYNASSTSNARVAKLPLIAEEDMIDFDEIKSSRSNLGASVQDSGVQIPLVGVLAAVALILMIVIAIRRNNKQKQPQVVHA